MAHECFEDFDIANVLKRHFVCVKVDKEERPDIDSIYMNVCQVINGSGGWPLSVFITPEQLPFFCGTYFPRDIFMNILLSIVDMWSFRRNELCKSVEDIRVLFGQPKDNRVDVSSSVLVSAFSQLEESFDSENGGFGIEPKFPSPHILMFLMDFYKNNNNKSAIDMVEKTLLQMYKGGIFDHIGFGFSRYSTDARYLVPHFEKMLYDNALLMCVYITAYYFTKKVIYKQVAEKIAIYLMSELYNGEGAFFSAQDADSLGEEGKYYVFSKDEILNLLGAEIGMSFCEYYDVTSHGNFEGKNILNLLKNEDINSSFDKYLPVLYEYRKSRYDLHLDDKVITSWNGLAMSAFSYMYQFTGNEKYLTIAKGVFRFIDDNLYQNGRVYVSYRNGKLGCTGFLDDYSFYIYGLICLYRASLEQIYLDRALSICRYTIDNFFDKVNGGFYLYGSDSEKLISRPKDVHDGAMPSGNSVMAYNMVYLSLIAGDDGNLSNFVKLHMEFMAAKADGYPVAHCFYLLALSMYTNPPVNIVCALNDTHDDFPPDAVVRLIKGGNKDYPILNNSTTYYVCKGRTCMKPVNNLSEVL